MSARDIMIQNYLEHLREQTERWRESIPVGLSGYDVMKIMNNPEYEKLSPIGKKHLKKYLENPTTFLILQGGYGLGKTAIACGVCEYFLKNGRAESARYIECSRFLNDLSYGDHSESDIIRELSGVDVLLIDDIGAGSAKLTPVRKNGIWELINARWANRKKTIFTTNLKIAVSENRNRFDDEDVSLPEWFGGSAWDRVSDSATTINFRGSSLRGEDS